MNQEKLNKKKNNIVKTDEKISYIEGEISNKYNNLSDYDDEEEDFEYYTHEYPRYYRRYYK